MLYQKNKKYKLGVVNDSPGLVPRSWYVEGKIPRGDKQESESELEFLQFSQIVFFPILDRTFEFIIRKKAFSQIPW